MISQGLQRLSKTKKSGMTLIVLVLEGESSPECHRVETLYCQGYTLQQKSSFPLVPSDRAKLLTQGRQKGQN